MNEDGESMDYPFCHQTMRFWRWAGDWKCAECGAVYPAAVLTDYKNGILPGNIRGEHENELIFSGFGFVHFLIASAAGIFAFVLWEQGAWGVFLFFLALALAALLRCLPLARLTRREDGGVDCFFGIGRLGIVRRFPATELIGSKMEVQWGRNGVYGRVVLMLRGGRRKVLLDGLRPIEAVCVTDWINGRCRSAGALPEAAGGSGVIS